MDIEQVYWTIGEVAKMIHRESSAIRHWEIEMPWTRPKLNKHGHRQYNRQGVEAITKVNFLLRSGMTHEGINKAYNRGYMADLANFFADKERGIKQTKS